MLIRQFPDIEWLKAKIRHGFDDKKAVNNIPLKHKGWPNVVLNTKTKSAERRDIKGPFSLFMNISGTSTIGIDKKQYLVNDQCYTLSNNGQHYDLLVDGDTTETFNIHFGDHFFLQSIHTLTQTGSALLDDPFEIKRQSLNVSSHSMLKTETLDGHLQRLLSHYQSEGAPEMEEEILFDVLKEVLLANSQEVRKANDLPIRSEATRQEVIKRLYLARDYIHSYFFKEISLDELSQISCLSKFHFLRLFKKFFSQSPHQYQKKLRINRALHLYKTGHTLEEITGKVGIENASSISRMIFRQFGAYPSQIIQ